MCVIINQSKIGQLGYLPHYRLCDVASTLHKYENPRRLLNEHWPLSRNHKSTVKLASGVWFFGFVDFFELLEWPGLLSGYLYGREVLSDTWYQEQEVCHNINPAKAASAAGNAANSLQLIK